MRFRLLLLVFLFPFFNTKAQVDAGFALKNLADTAGCAPHEVYFTNTSTGATSYLWDFGDKASSTDPDPVHTFSTPGKYLVKLTVTGAGGPKTTSLTVNVYGSPTANFAATTGKKYFCNGTAVAFSDSSKVQNGIPIKTYLWTFGDGSSSNLKNPQYNFPQGVGNYSVTLLVTDEKGCKASKKDTINIVPLPTAAFTPTTATSCTFPYTVPFSAANSKSNATNGIPSLTYDWDFSIAKSKKRDTSVTFDKAGSFPVILKVTDQNACVSAASLTVNIGKPKADFVVNHIYQDTLCKGMDYFFVDKSVGGTGIWDYGDGTAKTLTNHHAFQTGSKSFTVKLIIGGTCPDTAKKVIYIEEVKADFTSTPGYGCSVPYKVTFDASKSVNGYKYDWFFGNKTTGSGVKPSITYARPDTFEYGRNRRFLYGDTLLVTSKHGCFDKKVKKINDTLQLPNALFMPDKSQGCVPLSVTFSDSSTAKESIIDHIWLVDNLAPVSTGSAKTYTYNFTTTGIHKVRLIIQTNKSGCIDTSYYTYIKVGNPPHPDFSIDKTTVCIGDKVKFTDLTPAADKVDTWHYNADGTMLSSCPNMPDQSWAFGSDSIGLRQVTLTVGSNGCYRTSTPKSITVKGPWARANYLPISCSNPMSVDFTASAKDADNYAWDFGDGNIASTLSASNLYAATGVKTVIFTASSNSTGCPAYKDTLTVYITKIKAKIGGSDTVLCAKQPNGYTFDGSASLDVWGTCHSGYRWDFGDDTYPYISGSPLAKHSYLSSGIYTIRLTTTDINGCTAADSQKVYVNDLTADFSTSKKFFCSTDTVKFTNLSTSTSGKIVSYLWTFDNNGISRSMDTSIVFRNKPSQPAITYNIKLAVTDSIGCKKEITKSITPSYPDNTFSISSPAPCTGKNVTLTANNTKAKAYTWKTGDNKTVSSSNPFTFQYDSAATYTVWLTVKDSINCLDSSSKSLTIYKQPVAKIVTDPNTQTVCANTAVVINDSSLYSTTRQWYINGSAQLPINPINKIFDTRGNVSIRLVVNNGHNCPDETTITRTVKKPEAKINLLTSDICIGNPNNFVTFTITDTLEIGRYKIDFADGSQLQGKAPVPSTQFKHTYTFQPPSGVFPLTLYAFADTAANACSLPIPVTVNAHRTLADFARNDEKDTTVCLGNTIMISDSSKETTTWNWSFGDSKTSTNKTPGNYKYAASGTYDLQLIARNTSTGCKDTTIKKVRVHPLPEVSITGKNSICQGKSSALSANGKGTLTYSWVPITGLSDAAVFNPVASPLHSTSYTLTVKDSNQCTKSSDFLLAVQEPAPEVELDTTIIIGETVATNLDLGKAYTYKWSPTKYLTCSTCPGPVAQPLVDQEYIITRADTAGCFSVDSKYKFIVKPLTSVDVPTAFSPNGDNVNDVVYVKGWGIKKLISFKIYNRWGEKVFETSDINEGWDGYYKGELQNMDTYVYHVNVETWVKDKVLERKGTLELLR